MSAQTTKAMEVKVIRHLVNEAIKAGYTLTVDTGEGKPIRDSVDATKIMQELFSVDEEHLIFNKDGDRAGWVFLVHGNDGWDVINDNGARLESFMEPIYEWIDKNFDN